jgi:aminoglycoside phosphotransferase (APT) family kinase protein
VTPSPAPLDLEVVLSPDWLSHILGAPVVRVEQVESLLTIASKARFRVDHADGRSAHLCVKGYFAERSFASLGQVEVRFYTELAPTLGVRVPRCVHAGIDPDSGHGMILMNDLVSDGARFLTALSPYSVDAASRTLEQMAILHTAPVDRDRAWLAPRLDGYLEYVSEEVLQKQLDDGRAEGLSAGTRRADRVRGAFLALARRAKAESRHYIHGDAHAGNLYLDRDGQPGLVDWQVVQRGPWELDVAYHLAAVLDTPDRERSERALLGHYLDAVRARGGEPPSAAEAWDRYRDALAYGYFMWAITRRVERPVIEAFVGRLGSAVEHHDSLARLGV